MKRRGRVKREEDVIVLRYCAQKHAEREEQSPPCSIHFKKSYMTKSGTCYIKVRKRERERSEEKKHRRAEMSKGTYKKKKTLLLLSEYENKEEKETK